MVAAGLSVLCCLSPTLPLPPPSRPQIDGPNADGLVILSGKQTPGDAVVAENLRTGVIRGQRVVATGRYEIPIPAAIGDEMVMYFERGLEVSDSRYFLIPAPKPPTIGAKSEALGGAGGAQGASGGGAGGVSTP